MDDLENTEYLYYLSSEDFDKLKEIIDNPPPPSERMNEIIANYKRRVISWEVSIDGAE